MSFSAIGLADQPIWSSKLVNGWQDWSWAKVDKSGPTMKATAKAWQGIYFHHEAQKSSGFSAMTFMASGGAKGGQRLQVMAEIAGKPLKSSFVFKLKPGWKTITVPFKKLGLTGQAFDGLWIQAQTDASFEVKNVKLKS
jgi:hypothetical protein